jgi:hypothetical protein
MARTVQGLKSDLSDDQTEYLANILICHHHPYRHGDIDGDDYSAMRGAPELINLLSSSGHGPWLIIHGHKHHPRVTYAPGGGSSPGIFAAGSFGAALYPELQTEARNQMYFIDIRRPSGRIGPTEVLATFESWTYHYGNGWSQSRSQGDGLPGRGGLGWRTSVADAAETVMRLCEGSSTGRLTWDELTAEDPRFRFLAPLDVASLLDSVRQAGLRTGLEDEQHVFEVST